ncbi:hypothetical protein WJX79_005209 [Trebouxia sp. C0005]|nr:MAG: Aquaporin 8a [Trebouxia sp. A1-2]
MNSQMLSSSMQRCAVAPRATVRTSACPLLRPVAQMRGLAQHPHAKAFTSYTQTKLHAQLTSSKTPRSSRRGVCVVAARSEAAIDEEDTPKIATEFITQALFNYFSCSAVAIATQVGGSNAALVTFLMIAAHMVLVPLIAYVGAPASGAHFNPIITFSFMITGIMKVKTGIQYIIAQCVGGVLGAYAAFNLLPMSKQVNELAGLHVIPGDHTVTQAFMGEVFASFLFIWVIMGLVKSKKGWGQFGPFAIALGITFNMWITGPISSNCINPARALGPAVVTGFWEHHWVWWTAPFLGAALAAKLYAKYVMPKDQLKELRAEVKAA